jgi:CBS-domain-containing membrane protein
LKYKIIIFEKFPASGSEAPYLMHIFLATLAPSGWKFFLQDVYEFSLMKICDSVLFILTAVHPYPQLVQGAQAIFFNDIVPIHQRNFSPIPVQKLLFKAGIRDQHMEK